MPMVYLQIASRSLMTASRLGGTSQARVGVLSFLSGQIMGAVPEARPPESSLEVGHAQEQDADQMCRMRTDPSSQRIPKLM
jgi:hypothetical protein